jgi:ankyrin repeat protein
MFGVQAGANMYAVNSDGKTPFDVIKDVNNGNITDTLLQFGFTPRANAAAKTQARLSLSPPPPPPSPS